MTQYEAKYAKFLFLVAITLIVVVQSIVQSENSTLQFSLSPLEEGVFNEINLARTNPEQYLSFLEDLRPLYNGKRFERPSEIPIITQEGAAALDEALNYLRSAKPVPSLDSSIGLSRAASDHAKDQGHTGAMGHKGTDGSDPWDRMSRYGTWQRKAAENIAYGSDNAREIGMQQVIDDGVHDRGHRTNLFNLEFHFVGIGCEPHVRYRNVCVIDFAQGYSEKSRTELR